MWLPAVRSKAILSEITEELILLGSSSVVILLKESPFWSRS